ncbi:hypothetical protein M885DRAFT_561953 [Pelagophyceae sp. CCMP2097]|nr:hypothetical protein M885DRAFT_561953 [Pelagophyceae sp. CCMP2097]
MGGGASSSGRKAPLHALTVDQVYTLLLAHEVPAHVASNMRAAGTDGAALCLAQSQPAGLAALHGVNEPATQKRLAKLVGAWTRRGLDESFAGTFDAPRSSAPAARRGVFVSAAAGDATAEKLRLALVDVVEDVEACATFVACFSETYGAAGSQTSVDYAAAVRLGATQGVHILQCGEIPETVFGKSAAFRGFVEMENVADAVSKLDGLSGEQQRLHDGCFGHHGLSEHETMLFLSAATRRFIENAGAALITQGSSNDALFLVCDGGVDVEVDGARVAALDSFCFLGEVALLNAVEAKFASATCRTRTSDTDVLEWKFADLERLLVDELLRPVLEKMLSFQNTALENVSALLRGARRGHAPNRANLAAQGAAATHIVLAYAAPAPALRYVSTATARPPAIDFIVDGDHRYSLEPPCWVGSMAFQRGMAQDWASCVVGRGQVPFVRWDALELRTALESAPAVKAAFLKALQIDGLQKLQKANATTAARRSPGKHRRFPAAKNADGAESRAELKEAPDSEAPDDVVPYSPVDAQSHPSRPATSSRHINAAAP